ncbi:hypothetical protein Bca52824_049559 [Brassica carinata]|uniref:glucan endo-1,3-beta-D-glucosidase n=1 Tax=Brassica carinata TaxID=52824 RepID=A0A8X7RKK7_BRACI|nr:PREDICTED: glucan endo-1,3-beta-D-glucosidase-like [Brassica oleracea var. oleracea]KAG2289955.1 hypothetical protein Bca52824_049559 [Brassica carinata]
MDSNTQQTYNNMFDEVMDATYSAMNALGYGDVDIAVGETGWPSACDAAWCTPQNAANYNLNIIKLAQNIGTPLMPNRHIDIYLFALFKPVQPLRKIGGFSNRIFLRFMMLGSYEVLLEGVNKATMGNGVWRNKKLQTHS